MNGTSLKTRIKSLTRQDERYAPQAYYFVLDALDYASERLGRNKGTGEDRHVSVAELLEGVRLYALEEFGALARVVLERFGIYGTEDIGEIVFGMVNASLLNSQESDTREDFADVYDFKKVFEENYTPEIPW